MNEQSIPCRVTVSSKKIAELVFEKIFPAMQGEPIDAVVFSLICAAGLTIRPNLQHDKLQHIIMETSGFMMTLLQDEVAPSDAN